MADDITAEAIDLIYRGYGSRGAQASEVSYWLRRLAANPQEDEATIRRAVLDDRDLGAAALDAVRTLYQEYGGRSARTGEVATWRQSLYDGADLAAVRLAIVGDAVLGANVPEAVAATFLELRGAAATPAEVSNWAGRIRAGAELPTLRAQLLTETLVRDRVDRWVAEDYATYLNREPAASELDVWRSLFARGADRDTLVDALLTDGAGGSGILRYDGALANHLNVVVPANFQFAVFEDFNVRNDRFEFADPSILQGRSAFDYRFARELRGVDGSSDTLLTYDDSHAVLLKGLSAAELPDSFFFALNNDGATNTGIYLRHLGRLADVDELAFWKERLAAGMSLDTVLDAVLTDGGVDGSTNRVQRTVTVVGADEDLILAPTGGDFVIYGFDPVRDQLQSGSSSYFVGRSAAQLVGLAREVTSLDGRTDVLIDLGGGAQAQALLFVGLRLADLSTDNFLI